MFKILHQSKKSSARCGILKTAHGKIETPFFMPDATQGTIRLVENEKIKKVGVPALVVNTLHLYLQPGLAVMKKFGDLHKFINWPGPLLSDSGGYQVFSLIYKTKGKTRQFGGQVGKVCDDKVIFISPKDGSRHELTPEKSIQIQFALGTDMMVCLDDVRPNDAHRQEAEAAVARTIKWAKRCKKEFVKQIKIRKIKKENQPLLFGVVQGGIFPDLRQKCAKELVKIGFDGLGFGARPVDEKGNFLNDVLAATTAAIPQNYLRFALGVGTPEDVAHFAKLGWDMFDCVIPTREGRHGRLYINQKSKIKNKNFGRNFYKIINIDNAKFKDDNKPVDKNCSCELCQNYSAAYLHHLFKIGEPLAQRLATLHNLKFYLDLMAEIQVEASANRL